MWRWAIGRAFFDASGDSESAISRYSGGVGRHTTCRVPVASDKQTDNPIMIRAFTRMLLFIAAAALSCAAGFAQSSAPPDKAPPPNPPGANLPQDKHEGLIVSANSYADAERAKEKFGKASPLAVGILPVEVFLHNETLQPIRVDTSTIQLSVRFPSGKHQDIDWLSPQEVAAVVAHPNGPPAPQSRRFPIGIGSITDKKTDKVMETIGPLALDADIVPPQATIHGFLFFDLNHDLALAADASLYVPDVTAVPANKALMFFEVPLGK
jgi:hypothetical protein